MITTILFTFVSILQVFAISLGVGSSTLAIVNFFVAIADGKIDDTERKMMGIVYVVLRVAMVAILVTTFTLVGRDYLADSTTLGVTSLAQLTILLVLFCNALLMTAHIMPSTFGPSLQAGSWYTLGTLTALGTIDINSFSYTHFLLAYGTWLVLAVAIVNGIMAYLRAQRHGFLK